MTLQDGLVLRKTKSFYYVEVDGETHLCRIKGSLFQKSLFEQKVAIGDRVKVHLDASEDAGWIHEILPRKSRLSRPFREGNLEQVLVSNMDHLLIVSSMKTPPLRLGLIDRMIIMAERGKIHPVIVLNKVDLVSEKSVESVQSLYESLGYDVLWTSVCQQVGIRSLKELLSGSISALVGHSGVGKSSLLQSVFPHLNFRIGEVSKGSGKGKHTTTMAEMFPLSDRSGYIVDTPGVRSLGLCGVSQENLDEFFVEFREIRFSCRFKGCTHRHEPSCAIKKSVQESEIAESRYRSYCDIYESLE